MSAPLRHRPFRNLVIGQTVSALGDWMATFAMIVLVLDLTGSSAAVGGMLMLRLLPAVIAGPLATRSVSRWNRRRTMMAMDGVRVVVATLVPLVAHVSWVYACAFLLECGGLVFLPARDASTPDLVDEEDLPAANALILGSSYGTVPLGAAAFGLLVVLQRILFGREGFLGGRPYLLVFLVDALSFLVSLAFVRGLRVLDEAPGAAKVAVRADAVLVGVQQSASSPPGFLGAFRIPLVRAVLPPTVTVVLGVGTLFSVGVVFVRGVLHASSAEFGLLIALFGLGAAAGLGLLQLFRARDQLAVARVAVGLQGAVVATLSLSPNLPPALLGAAAFGGATAATLAAGMSVLQARLEGAERVQAFAVFHVVIRAGLSLAAFGAGLAVDLVGSVRWPLVGRLQPARLVLFCAGLLVLASTTLVREPRSTTEGASR